MRCALVMAASCLAAAVPAGAQGVPGLVPGARVRITAPSLHSAALIGELRAATRDSVVVGGVAVKDQPTWADATLAVPLDAVTRLEVSRGRHRHMARGAGFGFVAGALVGGVYGALQIGMDCPSYGCETSPAVTAVIGGAVFGGIGALVGLGIGAATASETWRDVSLAALRSPSVAPDAP